MKICLCGSTRFMDLSAEVNRKLTLAGHVVYSVAAVSTSAQDTEQGLPSDRYSNQATDSGLTADDKETLDLVHLRKIQESDMVVVIGTHSFPDPLNENRTITAPYIGSSTSREIKWAAMNEIDVVMWTEENEHNFVKHSAVAETRERIRMLQN